MAEHNETGNQGEIIAKDYLTQKGYQLLETNWRYQKAEVDMIAMDQTVLVFIEVKTRTSSTFGPPEKSVTPKKERLLVSAAKAYMAKINHEWEIRFDVVTILIKAPDQYSIHHFEDAFFPSWK